MTQPALDFSAPAPTVYTAHAAEVQVEVRQERRRRDSSMWRLLAYLQEHGSATNVELAEKFGIRFSGRVSDLRCLHHYRIVAELVTGGLWRYVYIGGPPCAS